MMVMGIGVRGGKENRYVSLRMAVWARTLDTEATSVAETNPFPKIERGTNQSRLR